MRLPIDERAHGPVWFRNIRSGDRFAFVRDSRGILWRHFEQGDDRHATEKDLEFVMTMPCTFALEGTA